MSANSSIEWTHHTFNPWWGCARVSPGCEHCYAEALAKRYNRSTWGVNGERVVASDSYWREPLKWNRAAEKAGERARVFCASMADVFEDRRDLDAHRVRLWRLIGETPHLDWLLLTKRPENAVRLASAAALLAWDGGGPDAPTWPSNIWLGCTAEDQRRADARIPHLLAAPAAVRFVSAEPLLGPVDLRVFLRPMLPGGFRVPVGLDWIIVGGESGPGARPFDVAWARSIVEECKAAGTACFVKQLGTKPEFAREYEPPLRGLPVPLRLKDRKGGDLDEFPADLRVREFPAAVRRTARK